MTNKLLIFSKQFTSKFKILYLSKKNILSSNRIFFDRNCKLIVTTASFLYSTKFIWTLPDPLQRNAILKFFSCYRVRRLQWNIGKYIYRYVHWISDRAERKARLNLLFTYLMPFEWLFCLQNLYCALFFFSYFRISHRREIIIAIFSDCSKQKNILSLSAVRNLSFVWNGIFPTLNL